MHSKLPPKTQINLIKIPKYEYLESDMSLNTEFLYKRTKKMCICMCAGRQASKATSKSISVLTRHLLLTQLFPIIQEYLPLWNVFIFVKVRIQLTWWEIAYSTTLQRNLSSTGSAAFCWQWTPLLLLSTPHLILSCDSFHLFPLLNAVKRWPTNISALFLFPFTLKLYLCARV